VITRSASSDLRRLPKALCRHNLDGQIARLEHLRLPWLAEIASGRRAGFVRSRFASNDAWTNNRLIAAISDGLRASVPTN
jgi:hypothetical protein